MTTDNDADREALVASAAYQETMAMRAERDAAVAHIAAARAMLRIECDEAGCNDWPDNLHLADVIEKHLCRSLHAAKEKADGELRDERANHQCTQSAYEKRNADADSFWKDMLTFQAKVAALEKERDEERARYFAAMKWVDQERKSAQDAQTKLAAAEGEAKALREALLVVMPMLETAFYDHYSAGNMPGSGYHHRVYHMISDRWGWRNDSDFKAWKKAVLASQPPTGASGEAQS